MTYIWIAIFAYLLFAISAVIDKFLLREKQFGHPAKYAFAIGMLSLLAVVVLAPFGFFVPSFFNIGYSLVAGALFTFALLAFFKALKEGETSRIVPVQGGFVPFFTLLLAFFLLDERLSGIDLLAFGCLVGGSFLISREGGNRNKKEKQTGMWGWAIVAAFLFALSFTLTKQIFGFIGFVNGLIWTRFGMAAGAILLLLSSGARAGIFQKRKFLQTQTGALFLVGQGIGALAGLAQNYAIAKGSVTIVNALQGTQFALLLGLVTILSLWYPKVLKEKISRPVITQKIAAVFLISLGVAMLAI